MKNAAKATPHAGAFAVGSAGTGPDAPARDGRTRDAVTQLLLERGALTAAELGEELGVSPAAIRRHLDAMLADGLVADRDRVVRGRRGRGRPAREFVLTESGRGSCGPHTYDDLAAAALRWISASGGPDAVSAFVSAQVEALEGRCRAAMEDAGDDPLARAEALARALSAEGYAASASALAAGGQLCQHHCPVAHVAAEFPQLCEAETQVISRLVGTHVQRLATIANGDGVCTTYIPDPSHIPGPRRLPTPADRTAGAEPVAGGTPLNRVEHGTADRKQDDPNPVRMR
ncbi:transcriptional regulator [Actinocatenispora rupis]|uniref:Helix-turn-helix type 11 domain-containing protein n=1 Tax=Actinocatenispora rupis TaxID=519421 RepID=A0A8J3IT41_9ACTN|nr:hypothetical protein Aru02nite_03050 [Actinocatenispora rupis]